MGYDRWGARVRNAGVITPLPLSSRGVSFLLMESFSNFDISGTATLIPTNFTSMLETSLIFNTALAEVAASLDMLCPAQSASTAKTVSFMIEKDYQTWITLKNSWHLLGCKFLSAVSIAYQHNTVRTVQSLCRMSSSVRSSYGRRSFGLAGHLLPQAKKT